MSIPLLRPAEKIQSQLALRLACMSAGFALVILTSGPVAAQTPCQAIGSAEFCPSETIWAEADSGEAPAGSLAFDAEGIALRLSASAPLDAGGATTASAVLRAVASSQSAEITATWDAEDDAFSLPTLALTVPDADIVALMSLARGAEHDILITTLSRGQIQTQRQFAAHRAALAALALPADAVQATPPPTASARASGDCVPLGGDWVCPSNAEAWAGLTLVEVDARSVVGREAPIRLRVQAYSLRDELDAAIDPLSWMSARLEGQGQVILRRLDAGNTEFDLPSLAFRGTDAPDGSPEVIGSLRLIEDWLYFVTTQAIDAQGDQTDVATAHRAAIDMLRQAP